MGTAPLNSVQIVGLQKDKALIVDRLHERGVLHIREPDTSEKHEELQADSQLEESRRISETLLELRWMHEHLKPYRLKRKRYQFDHRRLEEYMHEFSHLKDTLHERLSSIVKEMKKNESDIEKARARVQELETLPFNIDQELAGSIKASNMYKDPESNALYPVAVRIEYFSDKRPMGYLIFTKLFEVPEDATDIREVLGEYADEVSIIIRDDHGIIQGLERDRQKIEHLLKNHGYRIFTAPKVEEDKAHDIRAHKRIISSRERRNRRLSKKLQHIADRHLDQVEWLQHELTIMHERYHVTHRMLRTEKTFILEGYVTDDQIQSLRSLENGFPIVLSFRRECDGPTRFANNAYVRRFEFVTRMFGLPACGSMDPTPFVAFFLPLFFGFMFADVGYGIMLLAGSLVLMRLNGPHNKVYRDAGAALLTCSLVTVGFGVLFGSFFGNLIPMKPLLFDPFDKAKLILLASLAMGLIHINIGIVISIHKHIARKSWRQFMLQDVSLVMLQAAAALLMLGDTRFAFLPFTIALMLFFVKSSFVGFLDITSFVGAVFSYARLLALSFATAGIALGINVIAEQLAGLAIVGPVLFVLLIIVGHLFNFLLNVLGSSIHAVRLHYIEFFSRFYEGKGYPFIPFQTEKAKETI